MPRAGISRNVRASGPCSTIPETTSPNTGGWIIETVRLTGSVISIDGRAAAFLAALWISALTIPPIPATNETRFIAERSFMNYCPDFLFILPSTESAESLPVLMAAEYPCTSIPCPPTNSSPLIYPSSGRESARVITESHTSCSYP